MITQKVKEIYYCLRFWNSIDVPKFIYYNYLCRSVHRKDGCRIIPYKGAILDIHKSAIFNLSGSDLFIGTNKIGKSKAETYVKIGPDAIWNCNGGAKLCYKTTIDIQRGASINSKYFFMNVNSVMIVTKEINIGDDCLFGRDCVIYDSDFHRLLDENGEIRNYPEPVNIGNHVWLTNHVMIQKGVTIGDNVIVSAFTNVRKEISPDQIIANGTGQVSVAQKVKWSSETI